MDWYRELIRYALIIIGGLCLCHSVYLPDSEYWKSVFLILGVVLVAEGVAISRMR